MEGTAEEEHCVMTLQGTEVEAVVERVTGAAGLRKKKKNTEASFEVNQKENIFVLLNRRAKKTGKGKTRWWSRSVKTDVVKDFRFSKEVQIRKNYIC